MQRLLVAILLLVFPSCLWAQRFGGTPPSVKWKQIQTDTVRIIFPSGMDSQAQRVAALVHQQAAIKHAALGDRVKRINIVLQNQTTISNAYVGLGPFRSEFYLTPSFNNFDLGSTPWADQLAIHEYRHVQQFNNFHHGISNLLGVLFGEEGYALGVNASIPDWFFEGDAVYNETTLSSQGRGRLPQFLNDYPALWAAGKDYSWMKLRNGSLKDFVPSHYNLGYLLVNYGYQQYGLDFWGKVTRDASAFRGLFYPFQHAVKKHAGVNYKTFRKQAYEFYRSRLPPDSLSKDEAGPAPILSLNKAVLTNYTYPYAISPDSIIYSKTSTRKRTAFFIRDSNGQHRLKTRDISLDDQFSYRNGKLVYAAYQNDPRWRWRDYSVIKLLDVNTGNQTTLTHKSKYFTPDISASGNRIAAVYAPMDGNSEIHILDATDGKVQSRISSNEITVFTDPKFISEDSLITSVRLRDGKMALAIADIPKGSLTRLTDPTFNVIGLSCIDSGRIFFTASYKGADNIFAIRMGDPQVYQLTDYSLGNYYVNVANGKMSWSAFTADGYQLQQIEESKLNWTPVSSQTTTALQPLFEVSHGTESSSILTIGNRDFPVSKYRKGTRLLNFHSWRPYYEDPEFTFSLYGENVLNTLQTELYYLYNENDKTNAAGVTLTFAQWFPYINFGTQYTFDRSSVVNNQLREWAQLDTRVGLSIPLSWNSNRTFKQFNAGTNLYYRNQYNRGANKDSFPSVNFGYLQHYIQWGQQVEQATQHIYPRFGYFLTGNYQYIINKYKSWQGLAEATVYLPGFFSNHSIVVNGDFQETDTVNRAFSNRMAYSRGYNAAYFSRMWRISGNYHFPLWHMDFGFANIVYINRIRANAFYDLTRVYSNNKLQTADQRSFGGEIYFDTKWWNQYSLSFGFRVSRLLDRDFYTGQKDVNIFEFILPVNIFPK